MEKHKNHILLVDDEAAITKNLTPFLERSGFQITVANDGVETLQRVKELAPDLIVMDALVARMDGREALR